MTDYISDNEIDFTKFKPEQIEVYREKAKKFIKQIKKNRRKSLDTSICEPYECSHFQEEGYSCSNCCASDVWGDRAGCFNQKKYSIVVDSKEYDYTETTNDFKNEVRRCFSDLRCNFIRENRTPWEVFVDNFKPKNKDERDIDAIIEEAIRYGTQWTSVSANSITYEVINIDNPKNQYVIANITSKDTISTGDYIVINDRAYVVAGRGFINNTEPSLYVKEKK